MVCRAVQFLESTDSEHQVMGGLFGLRNVTIVG
jgi:hypothetical protein